MPSEFIRPVIPPVDNGSNVSQESVPMTPPFNNGSNVSQESVPVTPPFSNGSNVSQESVPMTPPLSPEKASSLACTSTSERKDGSEMAALPTTPDLSPSSSSSSCSIMIEMHVPEYKYGKLLGKRKFVSMKLSISISLLLCYQCSVPSQALVVPMSSGYRSVGSIEFSVTRFLNTCNYFCHGN